MNELQLLQQAIHEADESERSSDSTLKQDFKIVSDKSQMTMSATMAYENSEISLELNIVVPDQIKHFQTNANFDHVTEEQFNEAVTRIKSVLTSLVEGFDSDLNTRLASYGLTQEGENENGKI